ncbi:MAG: hypothetical protein AAGG59_10875 [Bacteroidota bacterium]
MRNCLCLIVFLASCSSKKVEFGEATKYFPSADLLANGVVNKYYEHYEYVDGKAPLIRIFYIEYSLVSPNEFRETHYGGGFDLILHRTYRFDSSKQILEEEKFYYNSDTISTEVITDVQYNWISQTTVLNKVRHYPEGDFKVEIIQRGSKNKILSEGWSAKSFEFEINTNWNNGERITKTNSESVFVNKLGMYSQMTQREDVSIRTELIEQMPLIKFEKLKDHGIQRVGHIDTTKTLDDKPFRLCNSINDLADYYNSNPDGRYLRNKNGLVKELRSSIDDRVLAGESGFLTFRFIVNCEGEAGRFVAEGVDLDYQPKKYPKIIIDHLYEALTRLEKWRPVIIGGRVRDAHFYVTFKLKNGEIIDIRP